MSLHLQGVWMNQDRIVGFRFVDPNNIKNGEAAHFDIDFKNLQIAFSKGMDIRGLKVENGKLVGSNGSIDRYTKMDYKTGKLLQKTQLVVLKKFGQSKYILCDGVGKVVKVSEKDMIDNIENGRFSIANGKLVNKDGNKYVCQISGQYDRVPDPEEENAKIDKIAADKGQFGQGIAQSMKEAREHAKSVDWSKEQSSYIPAAVDRALSTQDETSAQYRRLRRGYIELAKDYISEKGFKNASLAGFMDELKANNIDDRLVEEFHVDLNKHRQTIDDMASSAYSTAEIEMSMKASQQVMDDRLGQFEDCIQQPIVRETVADLRRSATEMTTTRNKQTGEVKEITVREKLGLALYIIQMSEPFYFYVIQSLDLVETSDIETMGVASKELVYNVDFVKDCQLAELVFVLMHEAQHALMGHVARGVNKTHMIYNIAADLYVNKSICDEFGLDPVNHPSGPLVSKHNRVYQDGSQSALNKENNSGRIRVRDDMLYSDKINPDVDTVESLYEKIFAEVQNQLKQQKQGGQQQGNNGQPQNGNGQQQGNGGAGQNQQNGQQSGAGQNQAGQQSGAGQQGQVQQGQPGQQSGQQSGAGQGQTGQQQNGGGAGQNQNGQQGQQGQQGGAAAGQGQQNGQGSGSGQGQQGSNGQGSGGSSMSNQIWKDGPWQQQSGQAGGAGNQGQAGGSSSGGQSGGQSGQQGTGNGNGGSNSGPNSNQLTPQEVDAVRKAVKKMFGVDPGNFKSDMVQTPSSANKSEEDLKRDVKNVQATANARMNQAGEKAYSTGLQAAIQRQIDLGLAPKVNWKTALRKMVQKQSKKDVQYNKPNRIFLSQDILLPTEIPDNLNVVDNIVIAIDTSGSITNTEIGQALTQIAQLLSKYKAHGEIMYWDTQVAAVAEFTDVKSALKLRPAGGGGTDPNCIFKYINADKKYKSHSKLTKLDAILIFTDGYFGDIDQDWIRKFSRKTVWIISSPQYAESGWKAPMGLTAPFKVD